MKCYKVIVVFIKSADMFKFLNLKVKNYVKNEA